MVIDRLRDGLEARIGSTRDRMDQDPDTQPEALPERELRADLIAAENAELARLYEDGTISAATRQRLERSLDLEVTQLAERQRQITGLTGSSHPRSVRPVAARLIRRTTSGGGMPLWVAGRARLWKARGVPEEPVTFGELEQLVLRLMGNSVETLEQQMLSRLKEQTLVGGKRVMRQELPELPKDAVTTVHRVKVSLYGAKPPVWRRLEIPSAMPLNRVHAVLQIAFDWHDYHLHTFETVCGEFGSPDQDDDWAERQDEATASLAQVAGAERAKVVYSYDFGDDWRHDIVVETIIPAEPGVAYPRCTGGRRDAPPEDCGGIWVFNEQFADLGDLFNPGGLNERLAGLAAVLIPAA